MTRRAHKTLAGALPCRLQRFAFAVVLLGLSLPATAATISGVVFDDLVGNALAGGETIGLPNNPVLPGVQVAIFADNGNNIPDAADAPVPGSPFTTDGAGRYTSGSYPAGVYWIRVDSTTVRSAIEPTEPLTNIWAEQTYGPVGAQCANGTGGTFERTLVQGNGPCYAGQRASVSDGPGALATSEHLARIVLGAPNLVNADFGFSFNVMTTVRGGLATDNDNPAAGRIVQGAINQFVQNANAIDGPNILYFVPAEPTNDAGAGQSWWRVDVSRSMTIYNSNTVFLELDTDGTEIDGTAYDLSNGSSIRNTNTLNVGSTGPVGVGADGLAGTGDEFLLTNVAGPELAIVNDRATQEIARGIDIHAFGLRVRDLAIYGFGDTAATLPGSDIYLGDNSTPGIDPTDDVVLRDLIIGVTPVGADPVANRSFASAIEAHRTTNGVVNNVYSAMTTRTALFMSGDNDNWLVTNSEFRDALGAGSDGVVLADSTGAINFQLTGNLIENNNDDGIVATGAGYFVYDNTVRGNADKGMIFAFGANNYTAERNLIENNGVGVAFQNAATNNSLIRNQITGSTHSGVRATDGALSNLISQNAIFGNGPSPVDNIGIDLYTPADTGDGTPPFVTLNDSGDVNPGANNLLNFPVIERADIAGPNLELSGWARPGSVIEFFIAAPDSRGFGEAQSYLTTLTEGTATDTDATSSAYSGIINGVDQGADTTNRFFFSIPIPAGVSAGTVLTSTATDGSNNTSEFSGNVTVVTPRRISGRVFEDPDFAGTATAYDGGANDAVLPNVDVEVYDAADTYIASTVTDASGNYTLNVPADGDYKVRVRSGTIGDSNTPPGTGFVAACGITDPATGPACGLAELTWANTAAALGGQDGAIDDTATADDAGPGDTWTPVTVSGADVSGVDFGFAWNVITNINDAGQGSLRQFILNVNAIDAGVTQIRNAQFHMQVPANESDGPATWWRIQLLSALPSINRTAILDATTQTTNGGDTNTGDFVHPVFGADKSVGTGADGIEATGDEFSLPAYPRPEIEIDGGGFPTIFDVEALNTRIVGFAMFNTAANDHAVRLDSGNSLFVTDNWFGVRANGADPGAGFYLGGGVVINPGAGILSVVNNNIFGYNTEIPLDINAGASVRRNDIFGMTSVSPNDDGITAELTTGQTVTIQLNRVHGMNAFCVETFDATGPFSLIQNTFVACGQGGGVEAGGVRVFGDGSTVGGNIVKNNLGAGVSIVQRAGTNAFNDVSANVVYGNTGLAIDIDTTNSGGNPAGDGVTPNDGVTNPSDPNDTMDYPVFTQATLSGTTLHVEGYVGTLATKLAGLHDIFVYKAIDDGDNNGEIETGDGQNVPHGELLAFIGSCTSAADGTFACDLTVPAAVALAVGNPIAAVARAADNNSSEVGANAVVTLPPAVLRIEKRAFLPDGSPIASGATLPDGLLIYYMLYVNNEAGVFTDASLQDALDPAFAFQGGTIRVDSSQAACTGPCTPAQEATAFSAALATSALTDAIDGDIASYSAGTSTLDFGNQSVANAQLDVPANRIWTAIFQVRTQ